MRRQEFSKSVRREALERSAGRCEAIGKVYGLNTGQRCNAPLSKGVNFDHYPIRAADGGPGTLENCAAVCLLCHRHKTRTFDIPEAAKGKRISDRHTGIYRHSSGRRSFLTNRNGPFKLRLNGEIVRR